MSRPPASAAVVLRSLAYVVWLYGAMFIFGVSCLPLLVSRRGALWAAKAWSATSIWGLHRIVGLRIEVRGLQYRPHDSALVAAKHQSMLDTVAPLIVLDDPCYVLKRELMRLPIFGLYAGRSGMITVDRGAGSKAIRALSAAAKLRLAETRQIVIFPEGTRQELDAPPDYKSGVAALYRELGLACTPLATNAGLFWPAHGVVRRPGVAVFEFLEPIPPGLKRAEFMRILEERIETASNALLAEGRGLERD